MTSTGVDSTELPREQCLALLPTAAYGRLVFTEGALPAVVPVAFVLDAAGIVLRTAAGTAVARFADGSIVAFQTDDVDVARRSGWSVTVVGPARIASDEAEFERLAALPLQPWVAGERTTLVVVSIGIVTGRRISGPAVVPAGV